jgi:hypothetical protein
VREVFDIGAKDKAELKRSDWLKFDGSLFGGGGDNALSMPDNKAPIKLLEASGTYIKAISHRAQNMRNGDYIALVQNKPVHIVMYHSSQNTHTTLQQEKAHPSTHLKQNLHYCPRNPRMRWIQPSQNISNILELVQKLDDIAHQRATQSYDP